jgi:hypothetical protein
MFYEFFVELNDGIMTIISSVKLLFAKIWYKTSPISDRLRKWCNVAKIGYEISYF